MAEKKTVNVKITAQGRRKAWNPPQTADSRQSILALGR
jgi:hypothetical protein